MRFPPSETLLTPVLDQLRTRQRLVFQKYRLGKWHELKKQFGVSFREADKISCEVRERLWERYKSEFHKGARVGRNGWLEAGPPPASERQAKDNFWMWTVAGLGISTFDWNDTPLHWAAELGNEALAIQLLSQNASVNAKDKFGYTPLHVATNFENREMDALLLSKGADVNAKTNDSWAALHSAAMHSTSDIVALLLFYKADVNIKTRSRRTPLKIALEGGKTENADLLRAHGGKE